VKYFTLLALAGTTSLSACTKPHHQATHFRKVLILGNSITYSAPYSKVGWAGSWGMAASAPAKDFVHLLTRRLQQETPGAQVRMQNIAEWEHTYWKYDLTRFDTLKSFAPDLLIVRLGENVTSDSVRQQHFGQHLGALVAALAGPKTKVVIASSFWTGNESIEAMQTYSQAHQATYVPLAQLGDDPTYKAIGKFANAGVASHPSDAGMQAIADAIWESI
jgi:lysophospholipase L1-like esterase